MSPFATPESHCALAASSIDCCARSTARLEVSLEKSNLTQSAGRSCHLRVVSDFPGECESLLVAARALSSMPRLRSTCPSDTSAQTPKSCCSQGPSHVELGSGMRLATLEITAA